MPYAYSNPERAGDTYALPDIEVFQLTAREVAGRDEDLIYEYIKRPEFRLAGTDGRVRDHMLDAMVEEEGIKGGWFWWACFPGCLPDSEAAGPFGSAREARADAQSQY